MSQPTFCLTVQATERANDPKGIRRLRALLKSMLRGYGLRCLQAKELVESDYESVNERRKTPENTTDSRGVLPETVSESQLDVETKPRKHDLG